jgi:hypothetical protein
MRTFLKNQIPMVSVLALVTMMIVAMTILAPTCNNGNGQDRELPVGSVVPSLLAESQFQNEYGDGWVLADGRSVEGSRYETITGNKNLPDLRGMFIRGKNNERTDGEQNPAGDLLLGAYQSYATALPNKAFVTQSAGAHNHSTSIIRRGPEGSPASSMHIVPANRQIDPDIRWTTTTAGTHSHTIVGGDAETRPRNVTVNFFIRIN